MDGWSDIEDQGEGYSMQKHRGKCKARQNVKNQVPGKVSWWFQMYQNKVLLLVIKYSVTIMGEKKNMQKIEPEIQLYHSKVKGVSFIEP